jgi:SAM-dependent methyltransferase
MNCAVLEVKEYFAKQSQAGLVIFDFGCGDKPYQDLSKNNVYIGIDIDKNNKKADIFSSVDMVPVKNNVADIVCSFFVLEHVYTPLSVLAEKFRILKPGGEMFMLVPLYWEEHEQPFDYWRYTKFSLQMMLENAGFKDIRVKPINAGWAILGMHLARICYSRGVTRCLVPLINSIFYYLDRRILTKCRVNKQNISNVMSYAVFAKK